jgi:hypothetical protein
VQYHLASTLAEGEPLVRCWMLSTALERAIHVPEVLEAAGTRGRHQRALSQRDAGPLGLRADRPVHELGVSAAGLMAGPAHLARAVGDDERADAEVAGLDRPQLGADLRDDADVLMLHWPRPVDRLDVAVGLRVLTRTRRSPTSGWPTSG